VDASAREYFVEHPENFDLRPPGKVFMSEYAKFIDRKNEKLGSAGQLPAIRAMLQSKAEGNPLLSWISNQ